MVKKLQMIKKEEVRLVPLRTNLENSAGSSAQPLTRKKCFESKRGKTKLEEPQFILHLASLLELTGTSRSG
jgi:hypothetical protein